MTKITLLETLIPVMVPAAIATLKHFLPRLPKAWLPVLAPLLGALAEVLATQQVGAGTVWGAVLGAAGVGLREIVDQLRKAGTAPSPNEPFVADPGSGSSPSHFRFIVLLALLPMLAVGCKTADETAFKTTASLEAAVEHAMNAWADYVVWKRAQTPADPALPDQETKIKKAYTAYRMTMSAAYAARAAYVLDQKAGLPAWQTRLDAARAAATELLGLVDEFLKKK